MSDSFSTLTHKCIRSHTTCIIMLLPINRRLRYFQECLYTRP
nr:MAG TPA: hypothetical protein [Bacteriophage sp.]